MNPTYLLASCTPTGHFLPVLHADRALPARPHAVTGRKCPVDLRDGQEVPGHETGGNSSIAWSAIFFIM